MSGKSLWHNWLGITLDKVISHRENSKGGNRDRNMDEVWSVPVDLDFGVPKGSVLGPVLFTMYSSPLGSICRSNSLEFQLFADD